MRATDAVRRTCYKFQLLACLTSNRAYQSLIKPQARRAQLVQLLVRAVLLQQRLELHQLQLLWARAQVCLPRWPTYPTLVHDVS